MNVGKYKLDSEQEACVKDESKNLLVVAGAGSGKTLTILGKILFLVHEKHIKPNEILCISFTNAASNSLKEKIKTELNIDMNVYTFHKLALEILKNENYEIAPTDSLETIIEELFNYDYNKKESTLYKYLNIKSNKEFKNTDTKALKALIAKFIRLFKANNYKLDKFIEFHKTINNPVNILHYKKEKLFLILVINTLLNYNKYLEINRFIDFDDMLSLSKKYVDKYGVINKYKYIIIDEFQDTSNVRFDLIKSIINKTNAKLMVVGDDFQSIYRFNGCDLDLFINFNKIFKNSKTLKIQKTYRNSNELITIAGNFIMKNKDQIKKELKSDKHIDNPINIIYTKNNINSLIESIYNENHGKILLLGRNNLDIKKYVNKYLVINKDKLIYTKNKDIDITFMSIHKSKGLEYDNVIILNNIDDKLGFPNQIIDNRILRLVSSKSKYPFDEERRLFYVALTRTKNKVYLITEKGKESIFIKELNKNHKIKIGYKPIYKNLKD